MMEWVKELDAMDLVGAILVGTIIGIFLAFSIIGSLSLIKIADTLEQHTGCVEVTHSFNGEKE